MVIHPCKVAQLVAFHPLREGCSIGSLGTGPGPICPRVFIFISPFTDDYRFDPDQPTCILVPFCRGIWSIDGVFMISVNYISVWKWIILDANQPACPAVTGGNDNVLSTIISHGLDEAFIISLKYRPQRIRVRAVKSEIIRVNRFIPKVKDDTGIRSIGLSHSAPKGRSHTHARVICICRISRVGSLIKPIRPANDMIGNDYIHLAIKRSVNLLW